MIHSLGHQTGTCQGQHWEPPRRPEGLLPRCAGKCLVTRGKCDTSHFLRLAPRIICLPNGWNRVLVNHFSPAKRTSWDLKTCVAPCVERIFGAWASLAEQRAVETVNSFPGLHFSASGFLGLMSGGEAELWRRLTWAKLDWLLPQLHRKCSPGS